MEFEFVNYENRVCLVEGGPPLASSPAGGVLIADIATGERSVVRKARCLPIRWSHDLGVWLTVPGVWLDEYLAEMGELDSEDHR